MKRKIFSLFLFFALIAGMLSSALLPMPQGFFTLVASASGDYHENLSQMLREDNGRLFSSIVIDTVKNTIRKNGGEEISLLDFGVDYNSVGSSVPVIPIDAINSLLAGKNEKPTLNRMLSKLQAKKDFLLDFDFNSATGKIVVSNQFQTKRLIVTMKNGKRLWSFFGAKASAYNGEGTYVLQYSTQSEAKNALAQLSKLKNVESVVCDKVVSASATKLQNRNGAKLVQADRYKKYLTEKKKTGSVVVAVIDTGCEMSHSFLKGRLLRGYNVYWRLLSPLDFNGHGTHVCGIIADNTPSNVKIMPIKVLDDYGEGSDMSVVAGIDYAVKQGVDVINLSLGGPCDLGDKCEIEKAVKRAVKRGVTVVVAAGNEAVDVDTTCPARTREAIAVAAGNKSGDGLADFTNFGKGIDIVAPGDNIYSSYLNNSYEELSGTSMASPFVAAAAANILCNNPKLKPDGVADKLKDASSDMLKKGHDIYSGYGYLNYGKLLGDNYPADSIDVTEQQIDVDYFSKAYKYRTNVSIKNTEGKIVTDRSFSFSSTDSTVASFDGRFITAKGPGKCKIVLSNKNGASEEFEVSSVKKQVWLDRAAKKYHGGSGTRSDPYLIKTAPQLAKLALDFRTKKSSLKKSYKLLSDIDLKGAYWISADYVTAVYDGTSCKYKFGEFTGVFDGNNHKIKNMHMFNEPLKTAWRDETPFNGTYYQGNSGFFCSLGKGGVMKNLGLENSYNDNFCPEENETGGLLLKEIRSKSKLLNCYTTGFTVGNGIAGAVGTDSITVKNCFSSATVLGSGLFSKVSSFELDRSLSRLSEKERQKRNIVVSNCFFCGTQINCAKSGVNKGGIISEIQSSNKRFRLTKLYNCFSAAKLYKNIGFAEKNDYGEIYDCYYLKGNSSGVKKQATKQFTDLKAQSESFFKKKSSYTNSKLWNKGYKWDFKKTWAINSKINGGYPYLKAMKPGKAQTPKTGTWLDFASSSFASGKGTAEKPYIIKTAGQLALLSKLYSYGGGKGKHFKLGADIDLGAHLWVPVGAGGTQNNKKNARQYLRLPFYGSLDGAGYTISNLKIDFAGDSLGFFARLHGAQVKNINFKAVSLFCNNDSGILCSLASGETRISNCSFSGEIKGRQNIGSVCYFAKPESKISAVTAEVQIDCESGGGLVGKE